MFVPLIQKNLVDDKENIPSQETIAEFKNKKHGKSNGATGCTSPVKKKSPRKNKKVLRQPQNWEVNKLKDAQNNCEELKYYSKTHGK